MILLSQIIVESLHLCFYGQLLKDVYFIDNRLFHIGLIPAVVIWILVKSKPAKILGLTLVITQFTSLVMEFLATIGYKNIIIEINSYYYSIFIFISLSFILSMLGVKIVNGIFSSGIIKLRGIYLLLSRCLRKGKRTD